MLEDLKQRVFEANMGLVRYGLVVLTWGNVSGIDRDKGLVVIKPSGVPYCDLKAEDMIVVDMEGRKVDGELRPSSDTPTHLVLYQKFGDIGGVVHTHSPWAVAWAQAGRSIPALGTTHADCFYGDIPCTRNLSDSEINGDYEIETGNVIIETFGSIDPVQMPGVLVKGHGPFAWGKDCMQALYNAVALENIAMIAYHTLSLNKTPDPIRNALLDRHFLRKHGKDAYYGQATRQD